MEAVDFAQDICERVTFTTALHDWLLCILFICCMTPDTMHSQNCYNFPARAPVAQVGSTWIQVPEIWTV